MSRQSGPSTMPLSGEEPKEGTCTRCDSAGRVWPMEQPADIVMELEWGYAWLCLDCWEDMGQEFVAESTDDEWWDWRAHYNTDLYRDASMKWGSDAQMAKASEEFAELAAVCARDLNRQADQQELLAELVDARIMMEQIAQHITDEALDEMVDEKLDQLAERLHGGDRDE